MSFKWKTSCALLSKLYSRLHTFFLFALGHIVLPLITTYVYLYVYLIIKGYTFDDRQIWTSIIINMFHWHAFLKELDVWGCSL